MLKRMSVLRVLAGMALAALPLPLGSCLSRRPYDQEPGFVREMEAVKAERVSAGTKPPPPLEAARPAFSEPPGWHADTQRPLLPRAEGTKSLELDEFFVSALRNSHQIRVFSDIPLIRETGIREAEGAFDIRAFVEAQYDRLNEPVGNAQISRTGGRFIEDETSVEAGLRKKFSPGTEVSLSQRVSDKVSNAAFFVPERQAAGTTTLRIVQPILSGGGVRYNGSVLYVAKLDTEIAEQEFLRQAESHLLEIARSYWSLYSSRAIYAQERHSVGAVEAILKELRARADADAFRHQILRAESALTSRRAEMVRSEMAILNAQDRLHALVNDEAGGSRVEVIPASAISLMSLPLDPSAAGAIAVEKRPEMRQAFLQLRAAAVRLGMNRNEVLPRLNLILEGRLAGLDQGRNVNEGMNDEWRGDEMGGKVGLLFEWPLGNNVGAARLQRRELELRQQFGQLRTTVDTILLEVRISAREVDTGWRDLQAKEEAARSAREEVKHLEARKDIEAMRAAASNYLSDLLAAQDRAVDAERALAQAVAVYQVALLNLQRAQGTLLEFSSVRSIRSVDGDLPVLRMEKGAPAPAPEPPKPEGGGKE
ncbi:MAG: TolC family protein [Planctomycetes bacterium]|nr:TolC family protein [Planctomycetota bacterium]